MNSSKYCSHCGYPVASESDACRECGTPITFVEEAKLTYTSTELDLLPSQPSSQPPSQPPSWVDPGKGIHPLLAIVCFLFPIIGIILFFAYGKTRPRASSQSGVAGFLGIFLNILTIILFSW